jgi:peptide/nickel transport system substrate-binding protein
LGAESLASQLDKLGIQAKVRLFEGNIYASQLRGGEYDIAVQFGTDYRRFAHPAPSFERYFGKAGFIRVCSGLMGPFKLKDGTPIDLEKHVHKMNAQRDESKVRSLVGDLAWLANEKLPFLTVYEKRLMIFAMDGKNVSGWPSVDAPIWSSASAGVERIYTYLMSEGILKSSRKELIQKESK